MTILVDKKRKTFGEDFLFEDFISLLKETKLLLNYENNAILEALKTYCFDFYCQNSGKINKYTIKKEVPKRLPFIKHNHSSIEGLKERGFDDEYINKKNRCNSRFCIEYWTSRGFSDEEAKEKISTLQSSFGKLVKGKSKIIDRALIEQLYGKDKASDFFRKRTMWCKEYWTSRGYSEDEAQEKISQYQKEMSNRNLNKPIVERKKTYARCKEYWVEKGYSEEDAKKKISELQSTFNLNKCIDKYGKEEGYKKWKERQIKWQESLNKVGFHQLGHSKISQELFNEITKKYLEDDKDYIFYETKNKEYTLKNNNGFYYRYDFCDLKRRKFIEFNGDIYHANPKMYKETDKPNPFHDRTAKEIWAIDEDKKHIAEKNGFKELIIWEKDYRDNKEKITNECIKFLFENE